MGFIFFGATVHTLRTIYCLRLLSKPQSLRWVSVWFWVQTCKPKHLNWALVPHRWSKRHIVRGDFFQKSERAHSAAPLRPFKLKRRPVSRVPFFAFKICPPKYRAFNRPRPTGWSAWRVSRSRRTHRRHAPAPEAYTGR